MLSRRLEAMKIVLCRENGKEKMMSWIKDVQTDQTKALHFDMQLSS